jgi:hypothetical protein
VRYALIGPSPDSRTAAQLKASPVRSTIRALARFTSPAHGCLATRPRAAHGQQHSPRAAGHAWSAWCECGSVCRLVRVCPGPPSVQAAWPHPRTTPPPPPPLPSGRAFNIIWGGGEGGGRGVAWGRRPAAAALAARARPRPSPPCRPSTGVRLALAKQTALLQQDY